MNLNFKNQIANFKSTIQISKILNFIFIFAICYLLFAIPAYAAAPCDINAPFGCDAAGLDQIEGMFKQFITVFVGFGFVVLLIMLIMAGFKYLTSGGEPKAVSAAHQTFMWVLLGIFFMAVVWIILLLIEQFTGVDVTTFDIKSLCGGAGFPDCQPKP